MRIKTCIEKIRNKFCIKFYKLYYFVHVFYVGVFVFKRFHFIFLSNVVEAVAVCTRHHYHRKNCKLAVCFISNSFW